MNVAKQESGGVTARRATTDVGPAQHWIIGFAGGLLGAVAMNLFSRAVSAARNGREATGAAPGYDRVGRGVQPPQADGAAEDDATVRVGTAAYRAVTGSAPDRATRSWLGTSMHYAFGGTAGACYAVIAQRLPAWLLLLQELAGTKFGSGSACLAFPFNPEPL